MTKPSRRIDTRAILNKILENSLLHFKRLSDFVEKQADSGEENQRDFILDPEFQTTVRKILRKVQETKWGTLKGKYLAAYQDCESMLTGRGGR